MRFSAPAFRRRIVSAFAVASFAFATASVAADPPAASPIVQTVELGQGRLDKAAVDERGRLRLVKSDDGYAGQGTFESAVVDLGSTRAVRVDWLEQWTAPQTWKKHAGNPIYGPKQSGAWDGWTNGVSIVRNPDGKSYKMFYSGRAGAGIGFAEAALDDPLTWKENPASPVLKPLKNWEGNLINQPRVVKVTDAHWRMYYTGWGYKPDGKASGSAWAFSLAESFDSGVTWKRYGDGEPLLERGPIPSPDDGGVFVPEVRRVGDRWMMWYTALQIAGGKQNIQLCLATSDDGVRWTKHDKNPVVTDDFTQGPSRNVISRCFVRYDRGLFQLWFSHAKPAYRIRYAESLDGANWEHSPISPVLDAGPKGAWDDQMVEYPEVDVVDGQWRLWFCGNGFGSVGFAEGVVETGLRLRARTGATKTPDDSWTPWKTVAANDELPAARYVQIDAELTSKNPKLSPALGRLQLLASPPRNSN